MGKARQKGPRIPEMVSHREVAEALRVDTETVREWVQVGEWPEPVVTIRQSWFYPAAAVREYLTTGLWPEGVKFKEGEGRGRKPADPRPVAE